jgi:hypothetical protein
MQFPLFFRLLVFCISLLHSQAIAADVDFPSSFRNFKTEIESPHIPKVAHIVFSKPKPVTWIEYVSIRSAIENIGVERVNIWIPTNSSFSGPIWHLILDLPGVVLQELEMPDRVYGNRVSNPAHVSDVVRLKILFEQGGKQLCSTLIFTASDSL